MRLFSLEYLLVAGVAAYLWYAHQEKTKSAAPAGAQVTYGEWARDKALECERTGGGGQWHAALGLTLPAFCTALAAAEMQKRICKDIPARC